MVEIVEVTPEKIISMLGDILRIYGIVHNLDEKALRERDEIMRRHFRRKRFKGLLALEGETLVGFSYGYTGEPGQWWYEKVHSYMPPEMRREWLGEHFEFVELAVHPKWQRMGIGTMLHDRLLEDRPEPVALLTVRADNRPAIKLYAKKGWIVLLDEFYFWPNGVRFMVMGKKLP